MGKLLITKVYVNGKAESRGSAYESTSFPSY
jgi:hypothetical protein